MNRKSIGVMPSLSSVRPVEVNSGEQVITVVGGIRRVRVKRKSEARVKRKKLKQEGGEKCSQGT